MKFFIDTNKLNEIGEALSLFTPWIKRHFMKSILIYGFGILCLLMLGGCSNYGMNQKISLNEGWEFRQVGTNNWLPATIPGSVHIDLLNNGIIDDPYYSFNELDAQWIEDEDWEYRTTFNISRRDLNKSVELVFHGLDTYADIYVNDSLLANTDNMFVGHSFNLSDLVEGQNELKVYFHSPVKIGLEKKAAIGYSFPDENEQAPEARRSAVFTRKAPFHYGWDWGPRLVTSGIWQSVELIIYENIKLADEAYYLLSITEDLATYEAILDVNAVASGTIKAQVVVDEKVFEQNIKVVPGLNKITIPFQIDNPKLWWCNGLGEPHLYQVTSGISKNDKQLDQSTSTIGVRTVEFVQEEDSIGKSFYFKLNGRPVFMKGANYIPSDHMVSRQDSKLYRRALMDAKEANMNTLRVWGGAIYEKDLFYELSDELGIMIWQDFMFACSMFPNDSLHIESIRKEAEYNVNRLKNHPSVVFWCGNNENNVGWNNWGWQDEYDQARREHVWKGYEKVFYEVLPNAVKKHDPELAYWPSSPQSSYKGGEEKLTHGDTHEWSIWFADQPIEHYWDRQPRFCSEYGVQSFPSMHSINLFAEDTSQGIHSDLMDFRQRCKLDWIAPGTNGTDLIEKYNELYFNTPKDFNAFIYVSQLMQAKALITAIDAHRSNMPTTMGSLYWQLNDCWPTMSWSTVDYYGNWKAAHYAIKEAFKNTRLILKTNQENVEVFLISANELSTDVYVKVAVADFDGNVVIKEEVETFLPDNKSKLVMEIPITDEMRLLKEKLYIQARLISNNEVIDQRITHLVVEKDLQLQQPNFTYEIRKVSEQEVQIHISSDVFAKNVWISKNEGEIRLSRNNFDLLAGKPIIITSNDLASDVSDLTISSLWSSYNQVNEIN